MRVGLRARFLPASGASPKNRFRWNAEGTPWAPSATSSPASNPPPSPPGTRAAKIRFAGTQRNTLVLQNCRLAADYTEPRGGFRPLKITYRWEENGTPKENIHLTNSATESYTITCAAKPVMKSIITEVER